MFVFVSAAPLQAAWQLTSNYGSKGAMMVAPPTTSSNQLMCSGRLAMTVGWGGGWRWLKRRHSWSNWQATTVNGGGATTALTSTTKNNNQQTCSSRGRGGQAEDDNGWQEVGCDGGGRGATVVRLQRRNSFAIRSWMIKVEAGRVCWFFFLGRVEFYLESYVDES